MKTAVRLVAGEYQFVIDVALVHEVLPACTAPLKDDYFVWRERQLPVVFLGERLGTPRATQQPLVVSVAPDSDEKFLLVAELVLGLVDLDKGGTLAPLPALADVRDLVSRVWRAPDAEQLLLELRLPLAS